MPSPGLPAPGLKPSVGGWGVHSQPFTAEPQAQGNGRSKVKSPAGKTQPSLPARGSAWERLGTHLRKPWFKCLNPFFFGNEMLSLHKTQGEMLSFRCNFAPRRHFGIIWGHFWSSPRGKRCYWHVVGRGRGYCRMSHREQNSHHHEGFSGP